MIQAKRSKNSVPNYFGNSWRIFIFILFTIASCKDRTPYQDIAHFSKVFGREKFYRLYLPKDYSGSSKRYPVIYFFHGWGGRYKSDDNARLAYEKIGELVDKYQVILVMWDGNVDEKEPRPYNIGNHQDVRYAVQMKDYFPELIHHIDSAYSTLPTKNSRGIIGFSMGGFMSYFLAGKYPELVSAAVAMTGSPEFFVGHPENHSLYPLRYTFENLREVKLRFHNSTADELTFLNTEVKQGAEWDDKVSFDYWQFEGGHVIDLPGETKVFDKAMRFVNEVFKNPSAIASHWSHYDLYPEFTIYDYKVTCDRPQPGFIYLRNVCKNGFGVSTHKWLPEGARFDSATLHVSTKAIYDSNRDYAVTTLRKDNYALQEMIVRSDASGRLELQLDQNPYEISIKDSLAIPELIPVGHIIEGEKQFLRKGANTAQLVLFFRGGDLRNTKQAHLVLTSVDSAITINPSTITVDLDPGHQIFKTPPFQIICHKTPPTNAAPAGIRLAVHTTIDTASSEGELVIPVMYDAPAFNEVWIDDARQLNDSTKLYGYGNSDGIVNAGERVMLYENGHRLRLYTDDPFVIAPEESLIDEVIPAKWPDGFTLSSVVSINKKCPKGHVIQFLANYETKEFMPIERKVHWGVVKIQVQQ